MARRVLASQAWSAVVLSRPLACREVRRASSATAASDAPSEASRWPSWVDRIINHVSDTTGLHELTRLKEDVASAEEAHEAATLGRSRALAAHDAAVQSRATTQSDLAVLLQRRDTWDVGDVERFTALTSQEHGMRGGLEASLAARATAEAAADAAQRDFIKSVQRRYHGELLWQEKYRALSLYSTWALIGAHRGVGSSFLPQATRARRRRELGRLPRVVGPADQDGDAAARRPRGRRPRSRRRRAPRRAGRRRRRRCRAAARARA